MELETLEKAMFLKDRLSRLKKSKDVLDSLTKGEEEMSLQIYVERNSDPFVVPPECGRGVINLLQDMLQERIRKTDEQFKAL